MNSLLAALLRALYPQRLQCHACGAPLTAAEGLLCGGCADALRALAYKGGRWETTVDETLPVAASAYPYTAPADTLVKALKFGSDRAAALPLAEGMAAVYAHMPALRGVDVCVAVPVHNRRLRTRGYNQAAVLAAAFAAVTGVPVLEGALIRVQQQRSQIGRGRQGRTRNVQEAFAVSSIGLQTLPGLRVLLVDDVLTTGATAAACAALLRAAGAEAVLLLTACRA